MRALHPGYAKAWVAIVAAVLALEVVSTWWSPDWPWVLLLAAALTVEGVAITRRGAGDTFSELNWAFLWGGWARGILLTAFGIYVGMRFYLIGGLPGLPVWAPRATLAVGFVGWYTLHILRFGGDG